MSEPPEDLSAGSAQRPLPPPTRAAGTGGSSSEGSGSGTAETAAPLAPAASSRSKRGGRKILVIAGAVVVLAIVIGILVLTLGGGDGTKQIANPLEVRQLVATFDCTSSNPSVPSAVKVTAGQEVVRLGRGGCAVVGPVIDRVDRATKVSSANTSSGCTVTFQSTSKYGEIVDKASVVNNGYARALVGGGYVLDLRATLYAPAKAAKLSVVFNATDQSTCTKVANALRRV